VITADIRTEIANFDPMRTYAGCKWQPRRLPDLPGGLDRSRGQSNSGLPAGGQWRCMDVSAVTNVVVWDGPWHTGLSDTRPQTCVDLIDIEVTNS
jgi:hypothetical protein